MEHIFQDQMERETLSDDDQDDYSPIPEDIILPQVRRSESPLRKRARHESGADLEGSPRIPLQDIRNCVRDETYYMTDGSCVLLVDSVLFNVHKSMLSRDSSSFSTMFSLPQGDAPSEGTSDENPIVLVGDTAEEFRNFLWALYALPHELTVVQSPQADLTKLIDIARVANKYSFKSTETWTLDAIQAYVNRKPSPILCPATMPVAFPHSTEKLQLPGSLQNITQLSSLLRLAQTCGHDRLLETMITHLQQLMSTSLQYAYLALSLADELNIRALRGLAYLEVMQKATIVCSQDQAEGSSDAQGRLVVNRAQQLRLLSGYHRLTKAWERLRTAPLSFDHAPSCGATWHQHGCTQSWLEFWKEKTRTDSVLSLGLSDVLGRLKAISKEFDRWGSATYMHHDCRMAAKRAIQEQIRKITERLPDYFSEGGEY